jgi:hypothetical protein
MGDIRINNLEQRAPKRTDTFVFDGAADGTGEQSLDDARFTLSKLGLKLDGNRGHFFDFDDFVALTPTAADGQRLARSVSGTGTVTLIDAAAAPASSEGIGWAKLFTTAAADVAQIADQRNLFRGGMKPKHHARVKVPGVFADATMSQGLGSGTSYGTIDTNTAGQWVCAQKSNAGGGTQSSVISSPTPVAGTIYTVRIEIEPTVGTRFYIDNVLLATLTQANAIPQAADLLGQYVSLTGVTVNDAFAYVDYLAVEGDR